MYMIVLFKPLIKCHLCGIFCLTNKQHKNLLHETEQVTSAKEKGLWLSCHSIILTPLLVCINLLLFFLSESPREVLRRNQTLGNPWQCSSCNNPTFKR